jgi:hypothetical protein
VKTIFLFSPEQLFEKNPIRTAFTYEITNGNFCSTLQPHAIIFIVSKSSNFDTRSAIRRTWGNFAPIKSVNKFSYLHLKLLFVIDIDETRLLSINLEQKLYHDIVQVRLPQHYTLSTYRDMSILHWTDTFCPKTMMTIKTDDDIFLNTYLLANIIHAILVNMTNYQTNVKCSSSNPSGIIYGIKMPKARVVRHSSDPILEGARYIVTNDEYPCMYYPDYMSGFGYITDSDARSKLLCTFFRDKNPFHMSDVYVTGILPEYLGIERKHLGLIISYRSSDDCEKFFSQNDPDTYACASSLHYNQKQINAFERFNTYWERIYENRFLYLDRPFDRLIKD